MKHEFLNPQWIEEFNAIHGTSDEIAGPVVTLDAFIRNTPSGAEIRLRYLANFDTGCIKISVLREGRPDARIYVDYGDTYTLLVLGDWETSLAAMSAGRLRIEGSVMKATGFSHLRAAPRFIAAAAAITAMTVDTGIAAPALATKEVVARVPKTDPSSPLGLYDGALPTVLDLLQTQIGGESPLQMGAQVYVSHQGRIVADFAIGDARPGQPMRPDHRIYWGCATKPVVTVALMQQVERGRLDLDEPVFSYIPEFGAAGKKEVTIRHLLLHTGGLDQTADGEFLLPLDVLLSRIYANGLMRSAKAGTIASYSIFSGFLVLGEVLRRLSGRSPGEYVNTEVLRPLGLDATLGMPVEVWRKNIQDMAPLYDHRWIPFLEADYISNELIGTSGLASCGIRGPVREQARFFQALGQGGANATGRVLTQASAELMIQRHREGMFDRNSIFAPNGAVMDYGLSVLRESGHYGPQSTTFSRHASNRSFGHDGTTFSTLAFVDPERDLAVAVATNAIGNATTCRKRTHALTDAIYVDLGLAPS